MKLFVVLAFAAFFAGANALNRGHQTNQTFYFFNTIVGNQYDFSVDVHDPHHFVNPDNDVFKVYDDYPLLGRFVKNSVEIINKHLPVGAHIKALAEGKERLEHVIEEVKQSVYNTFEVTTTEASLARFTEDLERKVEAVIELKRHVTVMVKSIPAMENNPTTKLEHFVFDIYHLLVKLFKNFLFSNGWSKHFDKENHTYANLDEFYSGTEHLSHEQFVGALVIIEQENPNHKGIFKAFEDVLDVFTTGEQLSLSDVLLEFDSKRDGLVDELHVIVIDGLLFLEGVEESLEAVLENSENTYLSVIHHNTETDVKGTANEFTYKHDNKRDLLNDANAMLLTPLFLSKLTKVDTVSLYKHFDYFMIGIKAHNDRVVEHKKDTYISQHLVPHSTEVKMTKQQALAHHHQGGQPIVHGGVGGGVGGNNHPGSVR